MLPLAPPRSPAPAIPSTAPTPAKLLGFARRPSLDTVSDPRFAIEFAALRSNRTTPVARPSWCCGPRRSQFDFIELPDAFCTGSSVRPRKKEKPETVPGRS